MLRPSENSPCTSPPHTDAYRGRMRLISQVPLFRQVPLANYPLLARAMAHEIWPAHAVVRMGRQQEGFLQVIESGDAHLEQDLDISEDRTGSWGTLSRQGSQIFLLSSWSTLHRGDCFGLYSSSPDSSKFPTVRAGSKGLVVLSVPFSKLEELGWQTCRQKQRDDNQARRLKPEGERNWLISTLRAHLNPSLNLSECQLERLANACKARQAYERETLLAQGGHDELFYVVESGMLHATQILVTSPVKTASSDLKHTATNPSSPFAEFSPCKQGFDFFGNARNSCESFDTSSPSPWHATVRTPGSSLKRAKPPERSNNLSLNQYFGPGELVGLVEAFFGAPNAITLAAYVPSSIWTCTRSAIQSALYNSTIPAKVLQPVFEIALGNDLEECARRNETECEVPLLKNLQHVLHIGEGSYGSVSLVVDSGLGGKMYALKTIARRSMANSRQRQLARNEREVLGIMDSKFIVHMHATYRDAMHLYFLLEPALGGDLFTFMHKYRHTVSDMNVFVRFASASVALAFQHMHSRKVVYRDLKPENVLITCNGYFKVCDFGLSKLSVRMAQTLCGTPEYVAPEVLDREGYTHMVDWWCLGIFIFELFSGYLPFQSEDLVRLYNQIRKGIGSVRFSRKIFTFVASSLVQALCTSDPSLRLGAAGLDELCSHPFFTNFDWHQLASGEMAAPFLAPRPPILEL